VAKTQAMETQRETHSSTELLHQKHCTGDHCEFLHGLWGICQTGEVVYALPVYGVYDEIQ